MTSGQDDGYVATLSRPDSDTCVGETTFATPDQTQGM
jgi:hypothetical protein